MIDLETDTATAALVRTAPEDAVLVVDGNFLKRPEIGDLWTSASESIRHYRSPASAVWTATLDLLGE